VLNDIDNAVISPENIEVVKIRILHI